MIVIFKQQLETIDVFGALRPVSDVFEREHYRIGIFSKSFGAQPRLISFACVERQQEGMNTIGIINGDKPRIAFQDSLTMSGRFKCCIIRLPVFREAPRASKPPLESSKSAFNNSAA